MQRILEWAAKRLGGGGGDFRGRVLEVPEKKMRMEASWILIERRKFVSAKAKNESVTREVHGTAQSLGTHRV